MMSCFPDINVWLAIAVERHVPKWSGFFCVEFAETSQNDMARTITAAHSSYKFYLFDSQGVKLVDFDTSGAYVSAPCVSLHVERVSTRDHYIRSQLNIGVCRRCLLHRRTTRIQSHAQLAERSANKLSLRKSGGNPDVCAGKFLKGNAL